MDKLSFKLEAFEGPLDLLLHLITKNKIDIYDIPILQITDQYFEVIESMQSFDMDISSDFIVMAAQLLYIKSKMLLPKQNEIEEVDPRNDLAMRLIEYKLYKEMATKTRHREGFYDDLFFKAPEKIKFEEEKVQYDKQHSTGELLSAFSSMLIRQERERKPTATSFKSLVGREKVSIEEKAEYLSKLIKQHKRLNFLSAFKNSKSRPEIIATFLAILELVRSNKLNIEYNDNDMDYVITNGGDAIGN